MTPFVELRTVMSSCELCQCFQIVILQGSVLTKNMISPSETESILLCIAEC